MTVPPETIAFGASLFVLTGLLCGLFARGVAQYLRTRSRSGLPWTAGLGLAAAAMGIEGVVYAGAVSGPLLQTYVFLSAAIVGVLSLGATRVLARPRLAEIYTVYTFSACAAVAAACALTPLGAAMVAGGIIAGNPPLLLLVLSSLVTIPATVLLLSATVLSLRRSGHWQTLMLAAGALILGAGGAFYIAAFPIALYYAEFLGIVLLFVGLVRLPTTARHEAPAGAPTRSP